MPQFRPDIIEEIVTLKKRVKELERNSTAYDVGFVDINGNALFSTTSDPGTVGFFGEESIQVATPATLADVIALLQSYGLTL